jgi:hypothetical protein
MGLLSRIYFNAVFGALGGLLGWLLFGVFGQKDISWTPEEEALPLLRRIFFTPFGRQLLAGGAFIGGAIGYFVVSVEALRDRSLLRFVRLATYGLLLGAVGGAVGMCLGNEINTKFIKVLLNRGAADWLRLLVSIFARGSGWLLLGLAVGASEGIAARSLGKFSYGTLGGAIGGFVGGLIYGLAIEMTRIKPEQAILWGAVGLIVLGACIGSLSALVQGVFQPASVKVLRGWQEGREYPLEKADNTLGRDEHADIALFRDMRVEKRHAVIQREGPRYILLNNDAPPDFTRVNDQPVAHTRDLQDGDRIQLGNVVLRFQLRAAQNRKRARA